MRKVLHRGKSCGEWKYGTPVYAKRFTELVPIGADTDMDGCYNSAIINDDETLGQYIGKTDKNGKKIFEGDIVEVREKGTSRNVRFLVVWGDLCWAGYMLEVDYDFRHIASINWCFDKLALELEVIGNKYDDPELLEE